MNTAHMESHESLKIMLKQPSNKSLDICIKFFKNKNEMNSLSETKKCYY